MKSILKLLIAVLLIILIAGGIIYAGDKFLHFNLLSDIKEKYFSSEEDETVETQDPLSVDIKTTQRTVLEGSMNILLTSNKEITVKQDNRVKLVLIKNDNGTFYYVAEISNIGLGQSEIKLSFINDSEQKDFSLPVLRETFNLPLGMQSIEPWEGSTFEINGDNLMAYVGKASRLTLDYAPTDLVDLNTEYALYTNVAGIMLRKEAADALKIMLQNLKDDTGKNVVIASGYRSYNDQLKTYVGWIKSLGQDEADKVSARPGFSEHQLGTVIDFIDEESNYELTSAFDTTAAGAWIKANASSYGFIQTYPEGREADTGYEYEAWHYRYVGITNAKNVLDSGKTLNKYLADLSK